LPGTLAKPQEQDEQRVKVEISWDGCVEGLKEKVLGQKCNEP